MKPLIIFDIETAIDREAVYRLTPPWSPATGKKEHVYWNEIRRKATLNPATSTICAIGIHLTDQAPVLLTETGCGGEAELLRRFWQIFGEQEDAVFAYWSGNNGGGCFDPRFLVVRSWVRRVVVPRCAYGPPPGWALSKLKWLDLAPLFLIGAEKNSRCSANKAAKTLGLIGQDLGWAVVQDKDELGVTGASFQEFLADECPQTQQEALDYLRNDLAIERAIANVLVPAAGSSKLRKVPSANGRRSSKLEVPSSKKGPEEATRLLEAASPPSSSSGCSLALGTSSTLELPAREEVVV